MNRESTIDYDRKREVKMGKRYFTLSRYFYWLIHQKELSLQQESSFLPYRHLEHRYLLLRKLKDVDMD